MIVYDYDSTKACINLERDLETLISSQEQAFIDFSNNLVNVPLPIQMSFQEAKGDCHIKAGYNENDDIFIVKIATGFYQNAALGLPASDGAILVFSKETGLLKNILYDGGYLTTLRTALAACIASKMTPWATNKVGIVGTGGLATLVLDIMKLTFPKADFYIWGRSHEKAKMLAKPYNIDAANSLEELAYKSDIIITTTASTKPFLSANNIAGNKHIIALGADDSHKSECDSSLFAKADIVITDSLNQASLFGDISRAIQNESLQDNKIQEIGKLLSTATKLNPALIITDLTGISAQDITIAKFVISNYLAN